VKIRGFRIELGEIEAALSRHAAVQQNVAAVREDPLGENIIVAYIVPDAEQVMTVGEVRNFLKDKLPDYMLPAIFVVLDELPLTPNGKVDRRALPDPDWDRANLEGDYVAARSPIEDILTGIWAEVLGVDQIGIHDSFFELRGHSLLATQVISRVREVFGLDIPLRSLFESPTIAGLADIIEAARKAELGLEAPPIERISREGELPLSFAQQRLWFLHLMEPNNAAYNVPAAIRLTGTLDVGALTKTLSEIVRRHEVLRTTFAMVNDRPVQRIAPAEPIRLPVLDLSELAEAEREARALELANEEAKRPFDLTRDPVMRVTLLRLSDQEHVMLFTMHHIVSDGWSVSILFNEIRELYTAFLSGNPSPLAELAIQYADFAHWQREWMQGEVLEKQLSYWKQQLKGRLAVLELPTDRPRPAEQTYRGGAQYLEVKEELAVELKRLSRQEGVTLFMTLLAGFKTLLYRYSGQEDIIVGSNIANRNRSEIGELIGYFVNTLVLRTDLSGDPTFRELLGRVREVALGAYAHQDLPFEKLVEQLHPQRDPGRSPIVQLMFDFHEYGDHIFTDPSTRLPGLIQSPLPTEPALEKFDLVLNMHSSNEGLYGAFQYSQDLFDASTVNRMLKQFELVLSNVAANPDVRLSELKEALLEADRQQQILDRKGFKEARRKMLQGVKQKSFSNTTN
jgi:acyl carrier protein